MASSPVLILATTIKNTEDYSAGDQTSCDTVLELASCLGATPTKPQVTSPLCYGPSLDCINYPDSSDGTQDGQVPVGDMAYGQKINLD
ncbi:MAG: hypothetical protein JXR16_02285 [Bermanella sp.]